jgi:hypothetical protein
MKAIFKGTLSTGFKLCAVVTDELANASVQELAAQGIWVEAVEVLDPAILSKCSIASANGDNLVVYGNLGDSIEVYGPFEENEDAVLFAEKHMDYAVNDTWNIFVISDEIEI